MLVLKELLYSNTHEWVKMIDDTTALTGLTDYAQNALSDLVYVNLPDVDDEVSCGETYGDIESVKAVSDLNSQLTGIVAQINEEVDNAPELINQNPYGSWLIKISDISEKGELMDADAYEKYCEELCEENAGEES